MVGYGSETYYLRLLVTDSISFEVPYGRWITGAAGFQYFKPIILFYAILPQNYIEFKIF